MLRDLSAKTLPDDESAAKKVAHFPVRACLCRADLPAPTTSRLRLPRARLYTPAGRAESSTSPPGPIRFRAHSPD